MKIGYARVSTQDQNLDRQLDALKATGCERVYAEKLSGKNTDRPELNRMLDALREGDIVIVCELTRPGRSTKDLLSLIEKIRNTNADLRSLKEGWLDTTTPQGRFMYTITAGLCEFERELTIQRTKDGLAAALPSRLRVRAYACKIWNYARYCSHLRTLLLGVSKIPK